MTMSGTMSVQAQIQSKSPVHCSKCRLMFSSLPVIRLGRETLSARAPEMHNAHSICSATNIALWFKGRDAEDG